MKWLYILSATIGAVFPVALVYQHLSSKYPTSATTVDLVILLDALGLSLLFSPIGAAVGLGAMFVLNLIWKFARRLQDSARTG